MARVVLVGDANNAHLQRWSTAMQFEGFDALVISPYPLRHPSSHYYESKELPVYIVPGLPIVVRKATTLVKVLQINGLLRKLRPDLVHVHYLSVFALGAVAFRSWKVLVSTWGRDVVKDDGTVYASVWQRWRHLVLRNAEAISATSSFLANKTAQYLKDNDSSTTNIKIISFGVDVDKFHPGKRAAPRRNGLVLGFVKHLEPKYGPSILIRSLALLHNRYPDLSLRIAGRGSLEAELKRQVEDLGLGQTVRFFGAIPHDEVPEFLKEIDIFVMPSVSASETFGVAALEAAAMEIPVVATDVGGVSEVVLHNQTGLLVPPGDVHSLARAIERLSLDRDVRLTMGRAARNYVLRTYRWADSVRRMKRLYDNVIGS